MLIIGIVMSESFPFTHPSVIPYCWGFLSPVWQSCRNPNLCSREKLLFCLHCLQNIHNIVNFLKIIILWQSLLELGCEGNMRPRIVHAHSSSSTSILWVLLDLKGAPLCALSSCPEGMTSGSKGGTSDSSPNSDIRDQRPNQSQLNIIRHFLRY